MVETVRGFVERELYPLEDEVERTGVVPDDVGQEIRRKVQEMGFYAASIPEDFGGGLDHLTFTLLIGCQHLDLNVSDVREEVTRTSNLKARSPPISPR